MAWVKEITIDGLAGRDYSVTIACDRYLNVLWGVNGCGKTSLLRIVHSALQGEPEILSRTPFKAATVTFESDGTTYSRSYEATGRSRTRKNIDSELVESVSEDVAFSRDIDVATAKRMIETREAHHWRTTPRQSKRPQSSFPHRYLPISRVASDGRAAFRTSERLTGAFDEGAIDRQFATELQQLWSECWYRESSRVALLQREGIAEILNSVVEPKEKSGQGGLPTESIDSIYTILRSFFKSQRIPFELGTLSQFGKSYRQNEALRRVAQKVVEIQSSTLEVGKPRRQIEDLISDLFSGKKQLRLGSRQIEVVADEVHIPVPHLSSGERQMVRMLVECLAIEGNCILIDEPELSMHVDWQNRLIGAMRSVNPDAQIIVATHSPEVMAEISDDHIFELVV